MSTLHLEIPGLPPRECSPNARVHWKDRSLAAQGYKEVVTMLGNVERHRMHWTAPDKAKVHVVFVLPDRRRRDRDNLIARAKPLIDALGLFREVRNKRGKVISAYGADIIIDDSPEYAEITYELRYEKGQSMTIVEVTPAYEPKTPLGKDLLRLRNKAIAGGMELLSEDEIGREHERDTSTVHC